MEIYILCNVKNTISNYFLYDSTRFYYKEFSVYSVTFFKNSNCYFKLKNLVFIKVQSFPLILERRISVVSVDKITQIIL